MDNRRATISVCCLLGASAVACTAAQVSAQSLEEVVVSARKRVELLKDVPLSVSAMSGDALEEAGAVDILVLARSTPSITLQTSRGTSSTLTAFIRGVGQQDPVVGFEGGVGLYLDDVYLARPQGTVFDLFDVERIEVLRGPQGTFYGRNTVGGAVKILTRRLGAEPYLELTSNVGNYGQLDAILAAGAPLSKSLRVGGTIATFNRDGFGDNQFTGGDNYGKDIDAVRVAVEWQPDAATFVRLAGDYSDDDTGPRAGHRLTVSNLTAAPVLDDVYDTRAGIETHPSTTTDIDQEVRQSGLSLTVDLGLNDRWALKSISAYRDDHSASLSDFDALPGNDFDGWIEYDSEQFSQELQLSYTGERWNAIVGAYYLSANAFNAFDLVLGNVGVTSFTIGNVDSENWALFADATHPIGDDLSLSLGGRFSSDRRSATITRDVYLGTGSPYFGNPGSVSIVMPVPDRVPTFHGRRTDEDFTPRVSLSWRPGEAHHVYVSYSQGFKGGGFDPRGAYAVAGVEAGFRPETVDSFEIGAKSSWLSESVVTNVAVFYADYTDVQIPGTIPLDADGDGVDDGFAGTVTNAARADIKGLEIEAVARLTASLSGRFSLGIIDADYREWIVNDMDVSATRVFQNTPKRTSSLSIRNEWPLRLIDNDGALVLIGSAAYRDRTHQLETPAPIVDQASFTVMDLSLVWQSSDDRFRLALHGRNLTDRNYKVAAFNAPTLGREGVVTAFYGPPRTVTASAKVHF